MKQRRNSKTNAKSFLSVQKLSGFGTGVQMTLIVLKISKAITLKWGLILLPTWLPIVACAMIGLVLAFEKDEKK
ncbi:MAG: hypothetical protein Q4F95_02245 [Oscillospiraceae bacterium]|nr:hypothetical protein [Oscillospiraceae bacterium]